MGLDETGGNEENRVRSAADRGEEYRAAHMKKALARKERRKEKLDAMEKARLDAEASLAALDEFFMRKALIQAEHAFDHGEVPIGSAIRKACARLGDWRLSGCTLYCTLEPCPMCAGAIVQSRIDRVVIGAMSPKSGSGGTLINILQNDGFNHRCEVASGVLDAECGDILSRFFRGLRDKKT